jgi:hypothetical protein
VEGYLREVLRAAQGEMVQHGAALGLGVAGMGGKNPKALDDLEQALFTNPAVAGEAAGYAVGLILLGTADAASAGGMLTYARKPNSNISPINGSISNLADDGKASSSIAKKRAFIRKITKLLSCHTCAACTYNIPG